MNKALLAVVCAASMGSYAMAATPIDLTAQLTTGETVETLQMFNLKLLRGEDAWVGMSDGNVTINPENKVVVTGNGETYEAETMLVVFGSTINIRLSQMIRRPGTYEIIIPEGLASFNGECNKEIKLPITVTGSSVGMNQSQWMQYFAIDPQDGASLSRLGAFTLMGSYKLELSQRIDATLTAPDGSKYQSAPELLLDDTQAQYKFNAPAEAAGAYVLTIPENTLRATLPGMDGPVSNPELVFHYTVKSSQVALVPVEVELAASSLNASTEAESFSSFFLNVTSDGDVVGPFTIDSGLLDKVTVQSATTSYRPSAIINVQDDPSAIELRFANPITAGGSYSITLPEGLLGFERFTNEAVTLADAFKCTGEVVDYFSGLKWYQGTWDYRTPVADNFEVSSLYRIFGVFETLPENEVLNIPTEGTDEEDTLGTSRATVVLPSGETFSRIISPVTQDNHAFSISLSLDGPMRTEGQYSVTIPAGSFNVNGNNNPEINVVFTIADKNTYTPVDLGIVSNPQAGIPLDKLTYIDWSFNIINEDTNADIYTPLSIKPGSKVTVTPKDGTPFELPVEEYNSTYYRWGFAVDFDPDITANGEYTVSIPEGVIRVRRESDDALVCNRAATYTYIVKNDNPVSTVAPEVKPAPGDVAALTRIEFNRPNAHKLYLPEPVVDFTLTLPSGEAVKVTPTTNANVEGEMAFLYLPETYTTPGTYTLTIPAGGFVILNAADQPVAYNGATYTYNVKEYTPSKLAFTADPADGSTLYAPMYVYVAFDDKVSYTNGMYVSLTTPKNETSTVSTSFNEAKNRLMLTFGYLDNSLYGDYVFTVPQGIVVTADGRTNEEFKLSYKYVERLVEKIGFICNPEQGVVAEFSEVTLTAPADFTSIERNDYDNTKVSLSVEKSGADEPETQSLFVKQGDKANQVSVKLDTPLTVTGDADKYDITLSIPEGTFTLFKADGGQVLNAAERLTWRLDPAGVAQLFGGDGLVNVYTLDGRVLYRQADASVLETLEEGIYVINGKKVSIRR